MTEFPILKIYKNYILPENLGANNNTFDISQ